MYCGVPSAPPIPLPDRWYRGEDGLPGSVVALNLPTNQITPMVDAGAGLDATNPFVSPDGRWLFFMDATNQSLWRVSTQS